jgi:hypothetical protein
VKLAAPAALLCLVATGCASMVNRPYEEIPVTSEPPGAVVSVDCGDAPVYGGTTPAVIEVSRLAETCGITVAKEGFAEQHIDFERQPSGATRMTEVPGVITGALLSAVALVITWDSPSVDGDFVAGAYDVGHAAGSAAGNAVDKKTGAAFKWVPGLVKVTLQPIENTGQ